MIKCTVLKPADRRGSGSDVFYAMDGGVTVGPVGELRLVAGVDTLGKPQEFEIFPAGTWLHVKGEPMDE